MDVHVPDFMIETGTEMGLTYTWNTKQRFARVGTLAGSFGRYGQLFSLVL